MLTKERNLRIAFFGSAPGGSFNYEKWYLWRGLIDAAQKAGADLWFVAGEMIGNSPDAVLYDLGGLKQVDGIIAWGAFSGPEISQRSAKEFLARFPGIPVVSVEFPVDGCSLVQFDTRKGFNATLNHLIHVHGRRKIAFAVEGDQAMEGRGSAFIELMRERGLYNHALVGNLLDFVEYGFVPGVDFDAIIGYSDAVAVKVIHDLRDMGYMVPQDVAVTGFNDGQEARGGLPPLTSVRLPFRWAGQRAVELLVDLVVGKNNGPLVENVDTYLITRRSCGCLEPMAEEAAALGMTLPEKSLGEMLLERRGQLVQAISENMGTWMSAEANRWAEQLLDLFLDEINQPAEQGAAESSREFLYALDGLLREALLEGSNISRWQNAITVLRRYLFGYLDPQALRHAEDLTQQMRVMVAQSAIRSEIFQTWHMSQRTEIMRQVESDLLLASDFAEMLCVLNEGLKRLKIKDFYLVVYEQDEGQVDVPRLVLAHRDGVDLPVEGYEGPFGLADILPKGVLASGRAHFLVIEALHFQSEQLGYIVFDAEPPDDPSECDVFQALRMQISSALKGVRLRRQLQEALSEAEEANQLKSRFLSMVSHELRTPLNLIVGLSEMAMRQQVRGGKASKEMMKKFNEQIYASGQHLDRLIRDVLDLASSQVGQMALMKKPMDIVSVLKDVEGMGRQLAEQKNLAFRAVLGENLPMVDGDKTRIRQVLLNLLSNAVKFTAHGEVVLSAAREGDFIQISVQDTGLGIAEEEQERIFDEFQQSDRSMVRGYGGIGLGLAITRRLVELHGGKIWVTSSGTLGGGSTFTFTLPVMAEAVEETVVPSSREGKVLILTKAAASAYDLTDHLVKSGFQVEELVVQDPQETLESLLASPPGAVVLDIAPASEQGWEIIKKLKENPATQDIPVLFFSLMVEENVGSVFEMDYLEKPVGADQLVSALRRHGVRLGGGKGCAKILIVDDEPGILDLHTRMVKTEMPESVVLQANDGAQGLEIMRREQPDLVLLDLMMPELDGFGVLKIMQEDQNLRGIPVIILSAQTLTRREISRLNQGVAAVLGKGLFSTDEIMERIQGVLMRTARLGSESQHLVHQALAYIHEHYKEQISRLDISRHLHVNEQYLSRCFSRELGIGPMAYLMRFRVEQAKRLLEQGNHTITHVALEVGLSSQSYFSRLFLQETGITPSAYQRGERGKK